MPQEYYLNKLLYIYVCVCVCVCILTSTPKINWR